MNTSPRHRGRVVKRWPRHLIAVALVLGLAASTTPAYGDSDAPGPALQSDPVAMETATSCPDGLASHPDKPVVLLVHGTGTTATESWPEGFGPVLADAGFDWCMVNLPGRALGDVQTSTEYVVAGVRDIHRRTGRNISLAGHSQGAMEVRWAVRWWPDVRAVVDDVVTFEGANRGLPFGLAMCPGACPPAVWQFRYGSRFMDALNRDPTPPGPSYTAIYSLTDFYFVPAVPADRNPNTIPGDGATNIAIQDVCPGRVVEHVQAIFDAASLAIGLDAFSHPGAADPARIDRGACRQIYAPGIDTVRATVTIATLNANAFPAIATGDRVTQEPLLRSYVR